MKNNPNDVMVDVINYIRENIVDQLITISLSRDNNSYKIYIEWKKDNNINYLNHYFTDVFLQKITSKGIVYNILYNAGLDI